MALGWAWGNGEFEKDETMVLWTDDDVAWTGYLYDGRNCIFAL